MQFIHSDLLKKTNFQSRVHLDAFGAYYPQYFAVQLNRKHTGDPVDLSEIENFLTRTKDSSTRVRKALEIFAAVHEFRHFHDFFGTLAGITLFAHLIGMLKEFAAVVEQLRSDKLQWELPLPDWARKNACPDYVRVFVNRCHVSQTARQVFQGNPILFVENGASNEVWRDIEFRDINVPELRFSFPAFPFAVGIRPQTQRRVTQTVSVWRPIGFETLIEGTAQALQRSYLEEYWPPSVVRHAWKEMTRAAIPVIPGTESIEDLLSRSMLPYNTTDLLMSKFLRQQGIAHFDRDLLMQATDGSLMESFLLSKAEGIPSPIPDRKATLVGIEMSHPGARFVEVLTQSDWTQRDALLQLSPTSDMLLELRRKWAAGKKPHELIGSSRFDEIGVIDAFVRHEIIVPLLDLRIKYGNRVFTDCREYIARLQEFPPPIMVGYTDGIGTPPAVDNAILQKWCAFCFLVSVMEQLLRGGMVVSCPRAYSLVPGFNFFEMAESGGCSNHIRDRTCLIWSRGRQKLLPNCRFKYFIRRLGLDVD
jgi:hypothetical protein